MLTDLTIKIKHVFWIQLFKLKCFNGYPLHCRLKKKKTNIMFRHYIIMQMR